tara:strand:- start:218 stop:460 length:243 start_codon:yes stop_codon:yes gene_type:complete
MELINTPNPNAKKLLAEHSYNVGEYLKPENLDKNTIEFKILKVAGVKTIFVGPNFLTITKEENFDWDLIIKDIKSIFDKL